MENREIKFRAWEEKQQVMFYPDVMDLMVDFRGNIFSVDVDGFEPITDLNLMQYTGLKDKNDVEIYEGDILYINDRIHLQIITFDEGMFCTDEFALFELTRNKERPFEVIGNIYENPELLETKN